MKKITLVVTLAFSIAYCQSPQEKKPTEEVKESSPVVSLSEIPWPEGNGPSGFMKGLQLVSLPADQIKLIINRIEPTETPQVKPNFRTVLEAAQYLGTHLNMGEPPKYITTYTDSTGAKFYIFSGGLHWDANPIFSEGVVLMETGEIRLYKVQDNK